MKHWTIWILLLLAQTAWAQPRTLQVEGVAPQLYVTHTVAPKENFYSIGRLYNISPREIAPFNNLTLEEGLSLNQTIRIPVRPEFNLLQEGEPAPDEALVPLYYAIKEKEGLYRVSENHYKVPFEYLRGWNKLTSDALPKGTRLIVGYLRVKKELSALAALAKPKPVVDMAVSRPSETPVVKTPEKQPEPTPVTPPVVKPAEPKPIPVEPKPVPVEPKPVPVDPKPVAVNPVPARPAPTTTAPTVRKLDGGAFKADYERQSRQGNLSSTEGYAAPFKSSSGWEDGKYYCLHNIAAPGTIVKITATATSKTIYAKVLDMMPDIKQNEDLLVRLSQAAADELGVNDGQKFTCTITFAR